MKRVLFYVVLAIQGCVILFFVFQFERMEQGGTEIKLVTVEEKDVYGYDYPLQDDAYVQYEITKIPDEMWSGSLNVNYNEMVYVLLRRDEDGIYHVEEASDNKLSANDEQNVAVLGQYNYFDEQTRQHRIDYNFQIVKNIEQYGDFMYTDHLIITLMISQWNQHTFRDVSIVHK